MEKIYCNGWTIRTTADAPFEAIASVPGSLPGYQTIASSPNTMVFRFDCNGRRYYSKTYMHISADRLAKDLVRGLWSERTVRIQAKMKQKGFGVPEIACYGRKKMTGTVIYEEVPGQSLVEWQAQLADRRLEDIFSALGHCIGRFHTKGFVHGDLHIGNIFFEDPDEPAFTFIDNERTKHLPMVPWLLRRKNLARMLYSLQYYHSNAARHWQAFYSAVCAEHRRFQAKYNRYEKSVIKKVERMTAQSR